MLYQFMPRLSDDEYTALEKSIVEHGVQVPIIVDEDRAVIDGHHRKEIADRLGIDCPRRFAMDLTGEQKRTLALSLNLDRRHLSREQKQQLVRGSIKADPHLSDRQHAERTGVSPSTVGFHRGQLEAAGAVSNLDTRTDSLGRQQPARAEPMVNTETGEVSDDYLPDDAAGEEVTPSAPPATSPAYGTEVEKPGEEVESTPPASTLSRAAVTEGDSKQYPKPEPKKAKRRPLTDSFFTAAYDMGKAIEKVARLTEDDRFPQNADQVAAKHRNDLIRSRDLLEQVIESLPKEQHTND